MTEMVRKERFPVGQARKYLEPGPVVLVTSQLGEEINIMTMGWHMVMEFSPSLIGCLISSGNYSFNMIRNSGECVINLPTTTMVDTVVGIGNCSGSQVDKFDRFHLTAQPGTKVRAPLVGECHANFECRLYDDAMIDRYNMFVFEIVAAHVAPEPKHPETLHYTGDGVFMVAGATIDRRELFTKGL